MTDREAESCSSWPTFRQGKRVDRVTASFASDATIAVSLRHRDAFVPTRQGLFFKRQPELLTGNTQGLGRKFGAQFGFEFVQSRVRSRREYLDNLIRINGPFRRSVSSREWRGLAKLTTLLFDTANPRFTYLESNCCLSSS